MILLQYIWHDCFTVIRPDEWMIVFDYWKDPRRVSPGARPPFLDSLKPGMRLYVVVSHHHKDHFNPEIFDWIQNHAETYYILSKDTARHARHRLNPASLWKGPKVPEERVSVIHPGETVTLPDLSIRAFGSTDIGNSYVVTTKDIPAKDIGKTQLPQTILHAGDLNAWLWLEESTPGEVQDMLNRYTAILSEIAEAYPSLDIALFPVDSRIGCQYWTGARMLLEQIEVGTFLPMHFGLGETREEQRRHQADARAFDLYAPTGRSTQYIALGAPGDAWLKP